MNYMLSPPEKHEVQAVDKHVGLRLKFRRSQLALTQQTLARAIGISYQQVQKYESGVNRISAGRIYYLSVILGVDISYFFEGLSDGRKNLVRKGKVIDLSDLSKLDSPVRNALMNLLAVLAKDPTEN